MQVKIFGIEIVSRAILCCNTYVTVLPDVTMERRGRGGGGMCRKVALCIHHTKMYTQFPKRMTDKSPCSLALAYVSICTGYY